MKRESWNILANTFEIKTRGSYRKAFVFAERHYAALKGTKGDATVAAIYSSFEPVYLDFDSEYSKWKGLGGEGKGDAQNFTNILLTMQANLKRWEGKIHFHYPEGTPEAVAIFPRKRTPFYKGSHIARTQAVYTLAQTLDKYAPLASVKTDVENFYSVLHTALLKHIGVKGAENTESNQLEEKRKNICIEMYGNLGLLMHHYRHDTTLLKAYFDMGVLKNRVHHKKKNAQHP